MDREVVVFVVSVIWVTPIAPSSPEGTSSWLMLKVNARDELAAVAVFEVFFLVPSLRANAPGTRGLEKATVSAAPTPATNWFGSICGRLDVSVRVIVWSSGRSPAGIVALLPSGKLIVPPELPITCDVLAIVPETIKLIEEVLLASVMLVAVRVRV